MSIETALAEAEPRTADVVEIWRSHFAGQVTFEQFRQWHAVIQQVPGDLLTTLVQHRAEDAVAAFQACCPEHVSLEEFRQMVESQRAVAPSEPGAGPEADEMSGDLDTETTLDSEDELLS